MAPTKREEIIETTQILKFLIVKRELRQDLVTMPVKLKRTAAETTEIHRKPKRLMPELIADFCITMLHPHKAATANDNGTAHFHLLLSFFSCTKNIDPITTKPRDNASNIVIFSPIKRGAKRSVQTGAEFPIHATMCACDRFIV